MALWMLLKDVEQVTDVMKREVFSSIKREVFSSSPLSFDWHSLFSVPDSWPIVVFGELGISELKETHCFFNRRFF